MLTLSWLQKPRSLPFQHDQSKRTDWWFYLLKGVPRRTMVSFCCGGHSKHRFTPLQELPALEVSR